MFCIYFKLIVLLFAFQSYSAVMGPSEGLQVIGVLNGLKAVNTFSAILPPIGAFQIPQVFTKKFKRS